MSPYRLLLHSAIGRDGHSRRRGVDGWGAGFGRHTGHHHPYTGTCRHRADHLVMILLQTRLRVCVRGGHLVWYHVLSDKPFHTGHQYCQQLVHLLLLTVDCSMILPCWDIQTSGANAQTIQIHYTNKIFLQPSPLHNQPSQKFRLLYTTLQYSGWTSCFVGNPVTINEGLSDSPSACWICFHCWHSSLK